MNPAKLGSLDNHRQQPWKAPLAEYIEQLYEKSFGRTRPEVVVSIEDRARQQTAAKAKKKAQKAKRRAAALEAAALEAAALDAAALDAAALEAPALDAAAQGATTNESE